MTSSYSSSSSSSSLHPSLLPTARALNDDPKSIDDIGNKLKLLYAEKLEQLIWKARNDPRKNPARLSDIRTSIEFYEYELAKRTAVPKDRAQFSINDNQELNDELRFLHVVRIVLVYLPKYFLDVVEARWNAVRKNNHFRPDDNCHKDTFKTLRSLSLGEMIKKICRAGNAYNDKDWILHEDSHNKFQDRVMQQKVKTGDLKQYDLCLAGYAVTGFAESLFAKDTDDVYKHIVGPVVYYRTLFVHGRKAGLDVRTHRKFNTTLNRVAKNVGQWLLPALGDRGDAIQTKFITDCQQSLATQTDRDALLRDKEHLLNSLDQLLSAMARLENLAQLDVALNRWNDVVLLGHDNDVCELLKLQVKTLKDDETMKDAFRGPELDDSSNGVTRSLLHAAEQHHFAMHDAYQRFFAIRPSLRKWYPFTIYYSLPKRKSDGDAAQERRVIGRGGHDTSLHKASIELDRRTKTQFRVIRVNKESDVRQLVGWQSSVSACLAAFIIDGHKIEPLDATQLVAPLDALYGWDDDDDDGNVNDNNSNK
mmetsp:Transcript_8198/g.14150  ORF Transcript_8198/g.14150 Transcript_8198/m.14150 type:complete len:535 (-) Transcript_8198:29-1633(-)